jgi:proline iminopeptidase
MHMSCWICYVFTMPAQKTRRRSVSRRARGRRFIRCSTAALLVFHLLLLGGCIHTAPFQDADGHVIPESIATMEDVPIGGISQRLWFRGLNKSNPALILLHGGPGASEAALFRHYNAELERHFLVVYWEQRGSGRSYHGGIPPESMTIDRFVRDLDEVVELVRRRFHKRKVVLLGHSWGTVLGAIYSYEHPDKVAVYVGVAQISDRRRESEVSCQFALSQAKQRANRGAIEELRDICPEPHSVDERLRLGEWVEQFGGMFHGNLSTGKLIWAALTTDEAGLVDLVKFGQGNRFSLEQLEGETSVLNLKASYRSFHVPIFFILGRYDWHVPAVVGKEYFDAIEAPCKRLVWFDGSAHNPPFEEPEKFNHLLIEQVLPLAKGEKSRERGAGC